MIIIAVCNPKQKAEDPTTLFDDMIFEQINVLFVKGGIMMFPLGILSLASVIVILERLLVLRSGRLVSDKNVKYWKDRLNKGFVDGLSPRLSSASILSQILAPLSSNFPMLQERFEERIADLARIQKHRLERGLVVLETISGAAPLFGLLGTALGMAEVFSKLSVMGDAKINALTSGISQALFTTVVGLFIGIPSLIAFNLYSRQVEKLMLVA